MATDQRKKRRGAAGRAAGGSALALLLAAAALPAAVAAPAPRAPAGAAGSTRLISVAVDGGAANGPSGNPVVSADGRVVAFTSRASDLVRDDTNDRADLFVRDLRRGRTQRVVDPLGEPSSPALSATGRYLAYTAQDGDTTAVVVRDLRTGATERADVDLPMPFESGYEPALSADGRTVAFTVDDSDFTTTGAQAVYVRDLRARRTERVSFPVDGDEDFRGFRAPTISADGRRVAYQAVRGTPPRGDWSDVYVHDRDTGGETQADTTPDGSPADGAATGPLLSADGTTLAFTSGASNLVPGPDPNDSVNPFVRDLRTGKVTRVDAVLPGPEGVLSVDAVSAHGSKLLLDTWPVHTVDDAEYVRDLRTGANTLVSPDKDGRPANAVDARMDARARTVVFTGFDDEAFVPGDTNGVPDVFVRTPR
ncbi:translocation protein TolB [Streptomyces sp. YIM 121038]|uniref:PD40 domain-containing protein n=1 Tax=Streptomyces sp. YIM 121038 TaxID=2136401 RepID=UPI001110E934|nr:PD40 domain-containing protein [Streptomyces sp. YIM 121038]QCX79344.1 translocation protein TolB [Streptomyces sp. YIM 121038]